MFSVNRPLRPSAERRYSSRYCPTTEADQHRDGKSAMLLARMRAVVEADQARGDGEVGAVYAYRQSLVDLAAIAEELADDLPPPDVPVRAT